MAQVLITKPGALNAKDKAKLRRADVVCVESGDPASVKLITPGGAELGGSDLFFAAMSGVMQSDYSKKKFAEVVHALVKAQFEERHNDA